MGLGSKKGVGQVQRLRWGCGGGGAKVRRERLSKVGFGSEGGPGPRHGPLTLGKRSLSRP